MIRPLLAHGWIEEGLGGIISSELLLARPSLTPAIATDITWRRNHENGNRAPPFSESSHLVETAERG